MIQLLLSLIIAATGIARDVDPALTALANTRAQEMAAAGEMGDHRYLSELNNGQWNSWGEVLGWNRFYPTAEDATRATVSAWMTSPSHHAVLVDRSYTRYGCATATLSTADHEFVYVCIFGNPVSAPPTHAPTPTSSPEPTLPDTAMVQP